jgi:hypothetical protein
MTCQIPEDHLHIDLAFALATVPITGFRRRLTDKDRTAIAKAVVEHLKFRQWEFSRRSAAAAEVGS